MKTIIKSFLKVETAAALFLLMSTTLQAQSNEVNSARKITSIQNALHQPWSSLFYIERKNGVYHMGDSGSQYDKNHDFTHLTFDISNNKVLANMGIQGTLKNVTIYRDSYFANCGPKEGGEGGWPGVWAGKDNSSFGPYSFSLNIEGNHFDLDKVNWDFKTGLLQNLFPITEFYPSGKQYKITVIAYAPISPDGSNRIRGLIYGLLLENKSDKVLNGAVLLPTLFAGERQTYKEKNNPWSLFDPYDYEIALGDTEKSKDSVLFHLEKGQSVWVPAVFSMLGDHAIQEINAKHTLNCLQETHQYFRKILGKMEIPGNPYLAAFYERQVMEAFGSIAMTAEGKMAGSNWGSYPTTRQIWMKDCFYSSLPFMQSDPLLAKILIAWFQQFGVRPKGNYQPGGVNHSVGLSVSSIILASQYYKCTGDKKYFTQNQAFKNYWDDLLKQLISSRSDSSIWLFPSRFISDGPIEADYHTGSNVCAWVALKGFADLLREVYNEPKLAQNYLSIADKVHAAIIKKCTIDGPYGRQFIEGVFRDGRKPSMISDGEESDITLMPFYGFLPQDDPTYLNYMKFSVSANNAIYEPNLYAITWFGVPSTAPGYLKGICAGVNTNELFADHGYYNEVRKVTDADGSIWWWSYGWAKEFIKNGLTISKIPTPYGELTRGVPGKSGWFSGIHTVLFLNRFIGLSNNDFNNTIFFKPMSIIGDFSCSDFPIGNQHYSVSVAYRNHTILAGFSNPNKTLKHLEITLPVKGVQKDIKVRINGIVQQKYQRIHFMDDDAIKLQLDVKGGAKASIEIE